MGPYSDLVLFLGEPAHGVEEEVAVALEVQILVRRDLRRPVDDKSSLILRGDRRDGQRTLGVFGVGVDLAPLEGGTVGLAPALLALLCQGRPGPCRPGRL